MTISFWKKYSLFNNSIRAELMKGKKEENPPRLKSFISAQSKVMKSLIKGSK